MNEFESAIVKLLDSGASTEDIAKQLSAALNSAVNKSKESKENKRKSILDNLHDTLMDHFKERKFTINDAAAMITLLVTTNNEKGKQYTPEQIKDFFDFAAEQVKVMPVVFETERALKNKGADLASSLEKIFNKSKEVMKGGTDRESEKPASVTHFTIKETDADKIARFLQSL